MEEGGQLVPVPHGSHVGPSPPPPSDPRISPFTAVPQFLIFLLFLLPGLALRHEDDADGGNEKNERGTGITRAGGASTRRDPRTRSAAA